MTERQHHAVALDRPGWWSAPPWRSGFNELRQHLHDRRFWIVQALVLLAAVFPHVTRTVGWPGWIVGRRRV